MTLLSPPPPALPKNTVLSATTTTSLTYPPGASPPPVRGPWWAWWILTAPPCYAVSQCKPLSPQDPPTTGPLLSEGSPIPHPDTNLGFPRDPPLHPVVEPPPGPMPCRGSLPTSPTQITASPWWPRRKYELTSLHLLLLSPGSTRGGTKPSVHFRGWWIWLASRCQHPTKWSKRGRHRQGLTISLKGKCSLCPYLLLC